MDLWEFAVLLVMVHLMVGIVLNMFKGNCKS
jgi:hypothetical protein